MSQIYKELVEEIKKAADEGVTLDHAERVAAKALFSMNELSESLTSADRDRRMRKQGLKSIKSAVRIEEVKKYEKKPTESQLDDAVNTNEIVVSEESAYDESEVVTNELERQFGISKEAHLYFRSISKGKFE